MSLRADYPQRSVDQSEKIIQLTESIAVCLPIACTIGCMLFPMHQFVHRKRNAVSVFAASQQLKSLVLLITRASNPAATKFWANLNDTDRDTIIKAMHVFYAEMLQVQPGKNVAAQRLIPKAQEFRVKDDLTILRLIEANLDEGKDDMAGLHERALVQWVLEQLLIGYGNLEEYRVAQAQKQALQAPSFAFSHLRVATGSITTQDAMEKIDRSGGGTTSTTMTTQGSKVGQKSGESFAASEDTPTPKDEPTPWQSRCGCAQVMFPKRHQQRKTTHGRHRVRVSGLFKEMDQDGDGIITMEEFREEGRRLAPLCEKEELDACFHLLDGEGIGFFNEDRFVLIFKGLTFRSRHGQSKDQEKLNMLTRNTLLRLSMKARGGEQTMERYIRTSRVRRNLMGFQRRLRERFAARQKLQSRTSLSNSSPIPSAAVPSVVEEELSDLIIAEDLSDAQREEKANEQHLPESKVCAI